MGGGGGGDGGAQARQEESDRKKQAARQSLNAAFGVAPTAPTAADFTKAKQDSGGEFNWATGFLGPTGWDPVGEAIGSHSFNPANSWVDQPALQAAQASYETAAAEASKNKTARDALYGNVRTNAFTAGKRGFDENKTRAARENKFALFGQGLQGGSVDVDENALLDRTYKQGLLDLGAKADSAKNDMQSSDEQTRLGLLQSIDAGMDEGSALSSAINQMKINSERATSQAQGTALGDLFGNAGLLYTRRQNQLGAQQAMNDNRFGLYQRPQGSGSYTGSNGTIYNGRT